MSIPVMTVVAAIRNELSLTTRDAANTIGINSGFLQQAEEFEYTTTPDYRTARGESLHIPIEQFFVDALPLLTAPLSGIVETISSHVSTALDNDRNFHIIASSNALSAIYVPVSGLTPYGPLFNFIIGTLMDRLDGRTFLKQTGDDVIDYFLDFTFSRFWGHQATQRRKHARSAGFMYNSLLKGDKNTNYLGVFDGCKDPREIFWVRATYTSRRSFLPYLFLYILTTRLGLRFTLPILTGDKGQRSASNHTTGVLAGYPKHCGDLECTSPFESCNVITLHCPGNRLVDFCYRPEGDGMYEHYCVCYAEKE